MRKLGIDQNVDRLFASVVCLNGLRSTDIISIR
jgi:hypothetical protein